VYVGQPPPSDRTSAAPGKVGTPGKETSRQCGAAATSCVFHPAPQRELGGIERQRRREEKEKDSREPDRDPAPPHPVTAFLQRQAGSRVAATGSTGLQQACLFAQDKAGCAQGSVHKLLLGYRLPQNRAHRLQAGRRGMYKPLVSTVRE